MARNPIIREPHEQAPLRPDLDDTVEVHYAALECPHECPFCFCGYVTITIEEDGEEHEEAVPCSRCISLR